MYTSLLKQIKLIITTNKNQLEEYYLIKKERESFKEKYKQLKELLNLKKQENRSKLELKDSYDKQKEIILDNISKLKQLKDKIKQEWDIKWEEYNKQRSLIKYISEAKNNFMVTYNILI